MADSPTITELLERRSFSIERTGYSSLEVHRLLGELRTAHEAGERLSAIIDATTLTEVSFGYDIAEVTDLLLRISEADEPAGRASTPEPDRPDQIAAQSVAPAPVTPPPAVPPRPVTPAATPPRSPGPPRQGDRVASGLGGARKAVAAEIQSVRFPVTRTTARYSLDDVDALLDGSVELLLHGHSMLPLLQQRNLRLQRRGQGYDQAAVDAFIRHLVRLEQGEERPGSVTPPHHRPPAVPAPPASQVSAQRTIQIVGFAVLALVILAMIFG